MNFETFLIKTIGRQSRMPPKRLIQVFLSKGSPYINKRSALGMKQIENKVIFSFVDFILRI